MAPLLLTINLDFINTTTGSGSKRFSAKSLDACQDERPKPHQKPIIKSNNYAYPNTSTVNLLRDNGDREQRA